MAYFIINIESKDETLRLTPQGDRKGVILTLSEAKGKNLILFSIIGMSSFALLRTTPRGIYPLGMTG